MKRATNTSACPTIRAAMRRGRLRRGGSVIIAVLPVTDSEER
jgi:hypothetical protein